MKLWTRRIPSFLVVFGLTLAACTDDDGVTPPDPQLQQAAVQANIDRAATIAENELEKAAQGSYERGIESDILRLENEVPGVGGMFYDRDADRVVVLVADVARNRAATADAADAYLAKMAATFDADSSEWVEFASQPVEIRPATYPFSQLVGWSRVLVGPMVEIPEFVAISADEEHNRVWIEVEDLSVKNQIDQVLAQYGVPADAVVVEELERPVPMIGRSNLVDPVRVSLRRDHEIRHPLNPFRAGQQIAGPYGHVSGEICTAAFLVKIGTTLGFLTAAHCVFSEPPGTVNELIYRGNGTGGSIGTVRVNPLWNKDGDRCGGLSSCALADAAFVALHQNVDAVKGTMWRPIGANTNNQRGRRGVNHDQPVVGNITPDMSGGLKNATIYKVGRTTGQTKGTIEKTCVDLPLNYDWGRSMVTCSHRAINLSVGNGDSGGPVLHTGSASAKGITFAGTRGIHEDSDGEVFCAQPQTCRLWYSRLQRVKNHLNMPLTW